MQWRVRQWSGSQQVPWLTPTPVFPSAGLRHQRTHTLPQARAAGRLCAGGPHAHRPAVAPRGGRAGQPAQQVGLEGGVWVWMPVDGNNTQLALCTGTLGCSHMGRSHVGPAALPSPPQHRHGPRGGRLAAVPPWRRCARPRHAVRPALLAWPSAPQCSSQAGVVPATVCLQYDTCDLRLACLLQLLLCGQQRRLPGPYRLAGHAGPAADGRAAPGPALGQPLGDGQPSLRCAASSAAQP